MKFGLKERYYDEIKILYYLFPNIDEIIIFGSRARGNYRYNSDIDIALKGNLSKIDMANIRNHFEEGKIPYTVDVVEYDKIIDEKFKKEIDTDGKILTLEGYSK